jgi:hypothetical protein
MRRENNWAIWVAVLAGSGSCTTQPEAVCEAFCDCRECTDADRSDCETRIELLMTTARDADCDPPSEAFFDCLEQDVECRHGGVEASCGTQKDGLEACLGVAICLEPAGGFCAGDPPSE